MRIISIIGASSFLNIYYTPSHFFDFPLCYIDVDHKSLTCSIKVNKKPYCVRSIKCRPYCMRQINIIVTSRLLVKSRSVFQ